MNRNKLIIVSIVAILLFLLLAVAVSFFRIVNTVYQEEISQGSEEIICPFLDAREFKVEDEYQFILGFTSDSSEKTSETQQLPCGEIRKFVYPTVDDAILSFEEYKQHALDIMPNNVEPLEMDLFLDGIRISLSHTVKQVIAVTKQELGSQEYIINSITFVECDMIISYFVVDPIEEARDFTRQEILDIVQQSFSETLGDGCDEITSKISTE